MSNTTSGCISNCKTLLSLLLRGINDVNNDIISYQNSDKTLYVAKRSTDPTLQSRLRYEFWHLCVNSIQVIENADHTAAEISVTGSGIHGMIDYEDFEIPLLINEEYPWNHLCFIEAGSHKIWTLPSTRYTENPHIISGTLLALRNAIGMNTVKFGDDPDFMNGSTCDVLQDSVKNLGYVGLHSVANYEYHV